MKRPVFLLSRVVALLFAALAAQAQTETGDNALVFGVIPARSPEALAQAFGPLASAIEDELGVTVRLRSAPDYQTFIQRMLEKDVYDLVVTGGDTVQYMRTRGLYQPIVRMEGAGVFSVIAVRADSPHSDLADLEARARVAAADRLAYATGLGFRRLAHAGIDPETDLDITFVPSQSAALAALERGQVEAAIFMVPVLRSLPKERRDKIRVVAESERAPPPAISVSTRLPAELSLKIAELLLNIGPEDPAASLLQGLGWPGFAPVSIDAYDALDWAAESLAERLEATEK